MLPVGMFGIKCTLETRGENVVLSYRVKEHPLSDTISHVSAYLTVNVIRLAEFLVVSAQRLTLINDTTINIVISRHSPDVLAWATENVTKPL